MKRTLIVDKYDIQTITELQSAYVNKRYTVEVYINVFIRNKFYWSLISGYIGRFELPSHEVAKYKAKLLKYAS